MALLAVPARAPAARPVATPEQRDIPSLTGLRGIAAVYVVLLHYFGQSYANPFKTFLSHGYLAVDLFFILSGFVMALNYRHLFSLGWTRASYSKFLGRRIARVYPLYLVATLAAFVLIAFGLMKYAHAVPLVVALVLNVAMVQTWGLVTSLDGPGWSISAEWAAYLLFPLLLVPTLFRRPVWGWVAGILSAVTVATLCVLPGSIAPDRVHPEALLNIHSPMLALPVIRGIAEFVLGLLAFRVAGSDLGIGIARSRWAGPAVCLAVLALLFVPRTDFFVVMLFPLLIVSTTGPTHAAGRLLASRPAQFLGVMSYGVYLLHDLFDGVLTFVHDAVNGAGFKHGETIGAIVCVALTLGLAYVTYHTIEAPGRRWLRYILEGGHIPSTRRGEASTTAR